MTVAEVRSTMAAVSARPVSMDAEPHDVADEADVESQAVVSEVLEAASAATRTLPPEVQVLLALRYYAGRTVAAAGAALGMEPGEAARAHTAAILQIHDAMLRAVV
jgi:DNA-directed RNA polymerase specialized sigma24 family protein